MTNITNAIVMNELEIHSEKKIIQIAFKFSRIKTGDALHFYILILKEMSANHLDKLNSFGHLYHIVRLKSRQITFEI